MQNVTKEIQKQWTYPKKQRQLKYQLQTSKSSLYQYRDSW